jgi:hypothetical protein
MIQVLVGLVLFFLVLFAYLHIRYHLKTNNDLDRIDLTNENIGKDRFEDVCALLSPFKFKAHRYRLMLPILLLNTTSIM